jgi:purine-binding chemotaxis protein CheW
MTDTPGAAVPSIPAGVPPERRACLFSLAEARFAIDVRSAREVVLFDDITTVPLGPRALLGVANLRGTVMPIADIRALLGLPEAGPARSVRALVVRDGARQAALAVDAMLGLEAYEDVTPVDGPATAPLRAPRPLMTGWIRWQDEPLPLLDVSRLLAALRATVAPEAERTAALGA